MDERQAMIEDMWQMFGRLTPRNQTRFLWWLYDQQPPERRALAADVLRAAGVPLPMHVVAGGADQPEPATRPALRVCKRGEP